MADLNRRQFNKVLGAFTVAIPVGTLTTGSLLHAAEAKLVDPESEAAKSLGYKLESDDEKTTCAGCNFYSAADNGEQGTCFIFESALVPANGTCTAFHPKK